MRINVAISLAGGGALAGVLALPAGSCDPPVPGVIVLHEVFGPAPDILDAADRFAEHGYAALTPDLFSAGRRLGCLARAMIESSRGCPGKITAAVEASRAWLRHQHRRAPRQHRRRADRDGVERRRRRRWWRQLALERLGLAAPAAGSAHVRVRLAGGRRGAHAPPDRRAARARRSEPLADDLQRRRPFRRVRKVSLLRADVAGSEVRRAVGPRATGPPAAASLARGRPTPPRHGRRARRDRRRRRARAAPGARAPR